MRTVGGDLYAFVANSHQVGVLVADVTGHGVPAALIASMAKVAFSSQADLAATPGKLLEGMNRALCGQQLEGQFVTATYAHIDTDAHCVRYSRAGHPPPLLWQPGPRQVVQLTSGGVFMGFDPDATYPADETPIGRGDRLVLYTDGLLEVTNAAGEFFGDEGLKTFVEANSELRADEFADTLLAHLRQWSGRRGDERTFEDDVTLAVVSVQA
jgi:serine phosphatase RsbU (regulator of sigma subunit)